MAGISSFSYYNRYANYANLFRAQGSSGFSSSFSGILSDYNSIRSGSYKKLLKSYYSKVNAGKTTAANAATRQNTDFAPWQATASDKAAALQKAADQLVTSNYFQKKTTKSEDGTMTTDYDRDAISRAVKEFASAYNSALDAAKTGSASVQASANSMVNTTNILSKSLADVGVTVGTNGRLSVDEATLKSADMDEVQSLFGKTSSYATSISSAAARLSNAAKSPSSGTYSGLYGSGGSYLGNFTYTAGTYYNRYL